MHNSIWFLINPLLHFFYEQQTRVSKYSEPFLFVSLSSKHHNIKCHKLHDTNADGNKKMGIKLNTYTLT